MPASPARFVTRSWRVAALVGAAALGGASLGPAVSSSAVAQPAGDRPPGGGGGGLMGSPDMLVNGLKSVDGCLHVDLAQWQSGKATIAAWFRDVESVKRWYHHPIHRAVMGGVAAGEERRPPMEHVDPDAGPILVLATITPTQDGANGIEGIPMPISQISIELFEPLPGGASVNGRLAPDTFEVPHHRGVRLDGEADGGAGGANGNAGS